MQAGRTLRRNLALAALLAPVAASASDADPPFARRGFYLGVGGGMVQPSGWDSDLDGDLDGLAAQRSLATASAAASAIDPRLNAAPVMPTVRGADLEDPLAGLDLLAGYRAHDHFAFEIEGEWVFGSNDSRLDVPGSTGSHRAEISDLWTLTANVKALPLTGRIQPFVLFGFGLHHSELDLDLVSQGLTTTASDGQGNSAVVPADFSIREREEELDGAIRAGIGVDLHLTRRALLELKLDYVHPFDEVEYLETDTYSLRADLLFRF